MHQLAKFRQNRLNRGREMAIFRFREFGLKTPIRAPKLFFKGENGEGVGRYWPAMNSFLLLGVYTSVSNLVKIDEEMQPWECPQTDKHTHGQTQNDFIICPMLYAIAMGQIIKNINYSSSTCWNAYVHHNTMKLAQCHYSRYIGPDFPAFCYSCFSKLHSLFNHLLKTIYK